MPPPAAMLTLQNVRSLLNLEQVALQWSDWERSGGLAAADPLPRILEAVEQLKACGADEAMGQALRDSATAICARPQMRRLLWHCHWLVFGEGGAARAAQLQWPALPQSWGLPGRLFYAVVLLSGMAQLLEQHRALGIAAAVTRETLSDLPLWLRHYREWHGEPGFAEMQWLVSHFTGTLFQLGRLQFRWERFPWDLHGWCRRDTGALCLLAGQGMRFDIEGQFADPPGQPRHAVGWDATYTLREAGHVRGQAIQRDGVAQPQTVCLDRALWEPCLKQGDDILGVHIPATGPMNVDDCLACLRRALTFFPAHFPDRPFAVFTCESWLLDSQLARYLPADSNIIRFQWLFHRYPIPGANAQQTYERVLGSRDADPLRSPQRTRLQRALADHVRAGGCWRNAGGVLLARSLA